ncbi:MAG: hypothetical protein ACLRZ6_01560 [Lachnospiraceae bacterium]
MGSSICCNDGNDCIYAQAVLADKYPNGQVKVFNWGEYIDEDLIDEFEDEYGSKLSMIHLIQTRLCIRV